MKIACIIVAGGTGQRSPGVLPKQYRKLAGIAVLDRTLAAVLGDARIEAVQCVIHPDHAALFAALAMPRANARVLPPVTGGATRMQSVRHGIAALQKLAPEKVLIHDAARPMIAAALLDRVIRALDTAAAVLPAIAVTDTLWRGAPHLRPIDRTGLWHAQTPQGFDYAAYVAAISGFAGEATDDIAVARSGGLKVQIVEGEAGNYKLTTEADFQRAERDFGMDVRNGTGFDVHAFTGGNSVTLCGVEIPFSRSLLGHSDADVAMHAITDAIFGGLAEGDIGRWFPPSDLQWKAAPSRIFLEKAVALAREKFFAISHIDCTIICEQPKIAPHAAAMQANIAAICGIGSDRVSVKATTTETLGFTGRGEGIAAMASATLVRA